MLYQPTVQQITTLLDHTRHKWPQLCQRVDLAERLLLTGQPDFILYSHQGLGASYDAWVCTGYRVDEKVGCQCATYLEHKEADAIIADRIFCKHLIAYHCYRRILLQMLNAGLAVGFLHLGAHSQLHNGRMGQGARGKEQGTTPANDDNSSAFPAPCALPRAPQSAMPVLTIVPCTSADPAIKHTFALPDDAGRFALWLGRQSAATLAQLMVSPGDLIFAEPTN